MAGRARMVMEIMPTMLDFLRLQPRPSMEMEMIFSNTPMRVERAAKSMNTKNIDPHSLPMGMARATKFVHSAIKTTFGYNSDTRFGVMFEPLLGQLTTREITSDYCIL